MKTIYLDCSMGAAGDMLTAALYELLSESDRKIFTDKMNSLGIPGVHIKPEASVKCGITGTHMSVKVNGMEEHEYFHALRHAHDETHSGCLSHTHDHTHSHSHGHEHHHDESGSHHEHVHDGEGDHLHTGMHEISHIIDGLNVSDKVKADITSVYSIIAEAEGHAHGIPADEVHFHEVGAMDAIADIAGVCILMEMISPDKVTASPVHTGSGHIHCTHGTLPVPAPAAAYILRGIPIYSGSIRGELCTPTGAALIKYFAEEFGEMPVMSVEKIGYGMGMKNFEQANCIRAMYGQLISSFNDNVIELHCNLDDMTPEAIGFAAEKLLSDGVLDVWTENIGMKKNRPGIMLCCLCTADMREKTISTIFRHTTTTGIREYTCGRYTLKRSESFIDTPYGRVRSKKSYGYGVEREKAEYEDLAEIARKNDISVMDILKNK